MPANRHTSDTNGLMRARKGLGKGWRDNPQLYVLLSNLNMFTVQSMDVSESQTVFHPRPGAKDQGRWRPWRRRRRRRHKEEIEEADIRKKLKKTTTKMAWPKTMDLHPWIFKDPWRFCLLWRIWHVSYRSVEERRDPCMSNHYIFTWSRMDLKAIDH